MKAKLQFLLPGEQARMMLIAACIGVMAGCAIIVFRETVDLVHELLFVRGHELLRIGEGGWRRLLLPLRRRRTRATASRPARSPSVSPLNAASTCTTRRCSHVPGRACAR